MSSTLGKPCPLFSLPAPTVSLPHSNWSDPEEKEDWNWERQKEKEHKETEQKERELKQKCKNNTEEECYLPCLQYRLYSPVSENEDTLAPTFTDTLVPAPEKKPEKEGEQRM